MILRPPVGDQAEASNCILSIMDLRDEIARQVDKLAPDMQNQVLRFVASLVGSQPAGRSGSSLRQFASSLDPVSAHEMTEAIEEECERIDAGQW